MSNPKLTKWFDGSQVSPVHVGVYQRSYSEGIRYCYWDGDYFFSGAMTPLNAENNIFAGHPSPYQYLPWRGLAVKP